MIFSIKITFIDGDSMLVMATDREQLRTHSNRFMDEPKILEWRVTKINE